MLKEIGVGSLRAIEAMLGLILLCLGVRDVGVWKGYFGLIAVPANCRGDSLVDEDGERGSREDVPTK